MNSASSPPVSASSLLDCLPDTIGVVLALTRRHSPPRESGCGLLTKYDTSSLPSCGMGREGVQRAAARQPGAAMRTSRCVPSRRYDPSPPNGTWRCTAPAVSTTTQLHVHAAHTRREARRRDATACRYPCAAQRRGKDSKGGVELWIARVVVDVSRARHLSVGIVARQVQLHAVARRAV
eukprot:scaffold5613_cov69-Phaeocystis_antarctica.AAC.1